MNNRSNNNTFKLIHKWRHFLVVMLLFVFILPYSVKVADMVVHHHFTNRYVKSAQTEYSFEGHFCPIPGFKYQTFVFQQAVEAMEGIRFLHKTCVLSTQTPYFNRYYLSFSLRAPPILDYIS